MRNVYTCSDCGLFFEIKIIPPPDRPDAIAPKGYIIECCPVCGDSQPFGEVGEQDE